jgi:hypothetical protein
MVNHPTAEDHPHTSRTLKSSGSNDGSVEWLVPQSVQFWPDSISFWFHAQTLTNVVRGKRLIALKMGDKLVSQDEKGAAVLFFPNRSGAAHGRFPTGHEGNACHAGALRFCRRRVPGPQLSSIEHRNCNEGFDGISD